MDTHSLSLIGFGEAGQAFLKGWRDAGVALPVQVFDIKTDSSDPVVVAAKNEDYALAGIKGCASSAEAVTGSHAVFSLVTADRAHDAARAAASTIDKGAFFFDCNSCAPGTKQASAMIIEAAGGRYVDTAVMAPVHPKLHQTPILLAGPHAKEAESYLNERLLMAARTVEGKVGSASAIKMVRSVLMKGLEAVILECVLTGRRAGVDEVVLESLEQTYPGFGWKERAAYMMERAATHGVRRAAEMREVAKTVREYGFEGSMSEACADWEQMIGELRVDLSGEDMNDHAVIADRLLSALDAASVADEKGKK